jgi:hypothetical protein
MRFYLLPVAIVGIVGIVAPDRASADPIYLSSTQRVYVELAANVSVQQLSAPNNSPFNAMVTASDGSNQATATLLSALLPGGIFGLGMTSVTATTLAPLAISQLIVHFLLTSPHAYSFEGSMNGAGSNGGFLADAVTGQSIFVIPGPGFASLIQQGVLQPGEYEFVTGVTSQRVMPGVSRFEVSLQLADTGVAPIPEPGTLLMVASGSTIFLQRLRRRHHPLKM